MVGVGRTKFTPRVTRGAFFFLGMKFAKCEKGNILSQYTASSGKNHHISRLLLLLLLFGFFLWHIWTLLLVW